MPDLITNYDGRLEQMALYSEAMLDNLAKINNAYHDDIVDGYSIALPNKLIKFKGINELGGKTLVWNQLVDVGTTAVSTISGRKYYTLIDGTASIITSDGTAISVVDDTTDMVCDLTLMFGSGKEPATTDAFAEIFPATHYSYNAGTLLSAGATEVVSKDANNTTIDTYPIPAEVQALDGYGWSAGSVYNYIDFENKKFVKCVGAVDLGTLTWTKNSWYFNTLIDAKPTATDNKVANVVCDRYTPTSRNQIAYNNINGVAISSLSYIIVGDSAYTDVATFTSAMSGVYLYYELATPVEIDISPYLTDDYIAVEGGGTLTFVNQNGDDYRIPVPVRAEYIGL